jgi:hypothetical protein
VFSVSSTIFNVRVEFEDGKTLEVQADQRDIAKFEQQPYGVPFYQLQSRPFTFLRFLAWNAGRRQKLHSMTWEQFEDECVSAEDMDKQVGVETSEVDPGQPAASAES